MTRAPWLDRPTQNRNEASPAHPLSRILLYPTKPQAKMFPRRRLHNPLPNPPCSHQTMTLHLTLHLLPPPPGTRRRQRHSPSRRHNKIPRRGRQNVSGPYSWNPQIFTISSLLPPADILITILLSVHFQVYTLAFLLLTQITFLVLRVYH